MRILVTPEGLFVAVSRRQYVTRPSGPLRAHNCLKGAHNVFLPLAGRKADERFQTEKPTYTLGVAAPLGAGQSEKEGAPEGNILRPKGFRCWKGPLRAYIARWQT